MEQATRWANGINAWTLRGGSEPVEDIEAAPATGNVATLRPAETMPSVPAEAEAPKTEWSTALNLVEEACTALRMSEERIGQLEAEAEQHSLDSRGELEALQAQLRLAQREIQRAYEQAATATARATAAEAWLDRLGGSIVSSFGRLATGQQQHRAS